MRSGVHLPTGFVGKIENIRSVNVDTSNLITFSIRSIERNFFKRNNKETRFHLKAVGAISRV